MAAPYIQPIAASDRLLSRYNVEGTPTIGFLTLASDEVDTRGGPFIGTKYDLTQQVRQFPRDVTPMGEAISLDDDNNPIVPDEVLDFVALRAHQIAQERPTAPIQSESIGSSSITYARPKEEQLYYLVECAWKSLSGYQKKFAGVKGESVPTNYGTRASTRGY